MKLDSLRNDDSFIRGGLKSFRAICDCWEALETRVLLAVRIRSGNVQCLFSGRHQGNAFQSLRKLLWKLNGGEIPFIKGVTAQ